MPCQPPHHTVHRQTGPRLPCPDGPRRCCAEAPIHCHGRDIAVVGREPAQIILHSPHGGPAAALPRGDRELPRGDVCVHEPVCDRQADLLQLVPCRTAHCAIGRQSENTLKRLHSADGGGAEAAVHRYGVQCAVVVRSQPQPELHQPHLHALVTPPQHCAGPCGAAKVALRVHPGSVKCIPSALPDCAVRRQTLLFLERLHGALGRCSVAAVHRDARQRGIKLCKVGQPELHLLHGAAARPAPQDCARPTAGGLRALGGLALAGQLGEILDAHIDKADFIPGGTAHHAVGGQAELLLKALDAALGGLVKDAVHHRLAEGRVVLRNAGQLLLQDAHIGPAAAAAQRTARIAGRYGRNVVRCDQLYPLAVVIPQDLQGVLALLGPLDRAPLLHAGAGDGTAIAVFGVVGLGITAALHIGVEQFGGKALHDGEHGAPLDIGLIVPRRACYVEAVPAAGVPLGPDAVQRQTDLGQYVGAQGLLRPGRCAPAAKDRCKLTKKMLY